MLRIVKAGATTVACRDCDKPAYHVSDTIEIKKGWRPWNWPGKDSKTLGWHLYTEICDRLKSIGGCPSEGGSCTPQGRKICEALYTAGFDACIEAMEKLK